MQVSFGLKASYVLLTVLGILFLTLFVIYKAEWFGACFSDLSTGLFVSLTVIFFIDRIIERNREKERLRVLKIALKRLRFPIIWHMTVLCEIYKASARNKPTPLPTTYKETFTDDYYKEIRFLDFAKDAPVALKRDWFSHLDLMTKSFKEKLERVLDIYSVSLHVELIEILERIINSTFFLFIPQARFIPAIDREHKFKHTYTVFRGMEGFVKEHVTDMLKLIEYFNSYSDFQIKLNQSIWRDDVAPKWGGARA